VSKESAGKVLVIADQVTTSLYRTAGCEVISVSTPEELLRSLERNIMRDDLSLILVSGELAAPVADNVEELASRSRAFVSYIPSFGKLEQPLDLRKAVLKALGMG